MVWRSCSEKISLASGRAGPALTRFVHSVPLFINVLSTTCNYMLILLTSKLHLTQLAESASRRYSAIMDCLVNTSEFCKYSPSVRFSRYYCFMEAKSGTPQRNSIIVYRFSISVASEGYLGGSVVLRKKNLSALWELWVTMSHTSLADGEQGQTNGQNN